LNRLAKSQGRPDPAALDKGQGESDNEGVKLHIQVRRNARFFHPGDLLKL
jgi:hypothetical protein